MPEPMSVEFLKAIREDCEHSLSKKRGHGIPVVYATQLHLCDEVTRLRSLLSAAEAVCRAYQNYTDSGSYLSARALSLAMERWQSLRGGADDADRSC